MREVILEERQIKIREYQKLRHSTNWNQYSDAIVSNAIKKDLYSVCASVDGEIVGICRLIGDGALYIYIQDLIILPEFRNHGIGKMIMNRISKHLEKNHKSVFVGLMAAEGTKQFYKSFGFQERESDAPGMYKYI